MNSDRKEKLLRASKIISKLDDRDTDLAKLVARAMQTGYEMGKLQQAAS